MAWDTQARRQQAFPAKEIVTSDGARHCHLSLSIQKRRCFLPATALVYSSASHALAEQGEKSRAKKQIDSPVSDTTVLACRSRLVLWHNYNEQKTFRQRARWRPMFGCSICQSAVPKQKMNTIPSKRKEIQQNRMKPHSKHSTQQSPGLYTNTSRTLVVLRPP